SLACEQAYGEAIGFWKNMGRAMKSKEGAIMAAAGAGVGAGACVNSDPWELNCHSGKSWGMGLGIGAAGGWTVGGIVKGRSDNHDYQKAYAVLSQAARSESGAELSDFSGAVESKAPTTRDA